MNDEYLTPDEVAEMLHMNRTTVQWWCRDGRIPATKIGSRWRIPLSAITGMKEPEEPPPRADKSISEDQAKVIAKNVFDALMAQVPITISIGG